MSIRLMELDKDISVDIGRLVAIKGEKGLSSWG